MPPSPRPLAEIRILRPVLGAVAPRLMCAIYEQIDATRQASEELARGEWSPRYGDVAARYGRERGMIGQDLQGIDRLGHLVTRRRPAMKPARANGGTLADPDAAPGADPRADEALRVMQLDTVEAQALFAACLAGQQRAAPTDLDVGRQVRVLAYLDEQACRLDTMGRHDDAARARAASRAIKAAPDAAADPRYAALFLAASLHASGAIEAL